jgi:tellurite resistance protein
MDGGLIIWIIIIGVFFLWPILKSNTQNKKISKAISSVSDLTINVKVEKIKDIECLVVYAKGWVNSKRGHSISGNITLSLFDITEDPGSFILTSADGFGEISHPHIFGITKEMELAPDSYFPEFSKIFIFPLDVLAFPFRGQRKIEAKVIYGNYELEIALGGAKDTKNAIGVATSIFDFKVEAVGYREFEKNAIDFEESAIQLAMFTASIDGSLDQIELDVIKSWCQKRSFFIEDEDESEDKKKKLTNFIQKTYKQAKEQKLTMSQIMSKIKKDLSEDQRYKVVELMLDVMAADSILDEKENDLIEKTVKSLNLDYKTFKAMRDARLSRLTKINVADGGEEKLFGLDENMSNDQKCTELRKQYSKWSGLTASSNKVKREQANKMVEKIAKLRQNLNC